MTGWSGAEEITPTHFCVAAIGEYKDSKRNLRGKKVFGIGGKQEIIQTLY